MSGELFERQVQQKMEGFTIRPSDPVWATVEKRIRKRRDRRVLVFWFAFIIFLAGAGFIWRQRATNMAEPAVAARPAAQGKAAGKQHATASADEDRDRGEGDSRAGDRMNPGTRKPGAEAPTPGETGSGAPAATGKKPVAAPGKTNMPSTAGNVAAASAASSAALRKNRTGHPGDFLRSGKEAAAQKGTDDPAEAVNGLLDSDREAGPLKAAEINPVNRGIWQPRGIGAPLPLKYAGGTVDSTRIRRRPKHGLAFGFTAGAGLSGISSGFFSGLFNKDNAGLLYNNLANANSFPGTVPGNNAANRPSDLKKGPAFFAAAELNRMVGKQWSITIGLRYAQYGTRIEVGPRRDSLISVGQNYWALQSVSGYYANTGTSMQHYTNRMQFLELPLGLEWGPGSRSRISVNAGFSAGWMFAANTLHYDVQHNVYYEDDRLLNRLQAMLRAGIRYSLLRGNGYSLRVGPQFSYSASHPFRRAAYGVTHLYFAGLEAGLILNKKKN